MKRLVVALFAAHVLTWVGIAFAYGVPTHRDLSAAAVNASVLQTGPTLLSNLGLKPLGTPGQTFPNYQGNRGTIDVLVQDGAEFEDNNIRSRSHFYDPLTNEAISALGHTSPDWALEDRDTYLLQNDSFRSTRQFFLKALTSQSKEAREEAWGRTFQGLGQVIHHLQDMAQPQHVRHDKHLDLPIVTLPVVENPSWYEEYTKQERPDNVRARLFSFFDGYEPVYGDADTTTTFNTPRSFWHTDDGKGIADYSNRGFVSAGTNFDQYDPRRFPLPEVGTEWSEDKTALCQAISEKSGIPLPTGPAGQPLPCLMTFIRTYVHDFYQSGQSGYNDKTSTYSIFNAELTTYDNKQIYTLNRFNFEAAYPFLIKRAVGYSAGFINYFFRGQIDLVPDPANPAGYLIQNLGNEDMNGTFKLYYDDADGNRQEVPGAEWTVAVAKGQDMPVSAFTLPTDPAPKTSGEYMLVFTGELGEEKPGNGAVGAVVAKKITTSSPFLLETLVGTYKSKFLDQGWERVGGGGVYFYAGHYIEDDLMFLSGGIVWRSEDGGRTFVDISSPLYNSTGIFLNAVTYLGGTELMALGTSDFSTADGILQSRSGTFYSPDLGVTWGISPYEIHSNAICYVGNGVVLLNGADFEHYQQGAFVLYKSTDKGISWSEVRPTLDGHVVQGCTDTSCTDEWVIGTMAWNQLEGEGSVMLAEGRLRIFTHPDETDTCGVWKSVDGGNTWRYIPLPTGDLCPSGINSIAISPQGEALMAIYTDSSFESTLLYKSTDAGETWVLANDPEGSGSFGVLYFKNNLKVN